MDGERIKGKKPDEANSQPLPFSTQPLWKFLLEMLNDTYRYGNIIAWTGNGTEFKLRDHQGVAREWGKRRNRANMTYEKMSRALRYYYKKNILRKVAGKKFVYRFVNPDEFESANDEGIKYAESDDQSEPADVPTPPPTQFLAYPKISDDFQFGTHLTFESVPSYHSWISWGEAPLAMKGW